MALNDPDGVSGVAAIRHYEPSLQEQTLQYESTGKNKKIEKNLNLGVHPIVVTSYLLLCRPLVQETSPMLQLVMRKPFRSIPTVSFFTRLAYMH